MKSWNKFSFSKNVQNIENWFNSDVVVWVMQTQQDSWQWSGALQPNTQTYNAMVSRIQTVSWVLAMVKYLNGKNSYMIHTWHYGRRNQFLAGIKWEISSWRISFVAQRFSWSLVSTFQILQFLNHKMVEEVSTKIYWSRVVNLSYSLLCSLCFVQVISTS